MSQETTSIETTLPPLPPIFAACVAQESGRYKLETPWIMGHIWSTRAYALYYCGDGLVPLRVLVSPLAVLRTAAGGKRR